jgi:hypothetical protein
LGAVVQVEAVALSAALAAALMIPVAAGPPGYLKQKSRQCRISKTEWLHTARYILCMPGQAYFTDFPQFSITAVCLSIGYLGGAPNIMKVKA